MTKLLSSLAKAENPCVLALGPDETEETITKVRAFSSADEKNPMVITSNLDTIESLDGTEFASAKGEDNADLTVEVAGSDDVLEGMVVVGDCSSCESTIFLSEEVASDLDGETIPCVSCSAEATVEVAYFGDLVESSDDDMDDDGDDDKVSEDDMEDEIDDLDTTDDDDDDSMPGDSDDSDEEEDLGKDDDEDKEKKDDDSKKKEKPAAPAKETKDGEAADGEGDDEEDDGSSEEADTEDEGEDVETVDVESTVPIASQVEEYEAKDVEMISVSDDNSTIASVRMFLGDFHIGTIRKEQASDDNQALFERPVGLRNTVHAALAKDFPALRSGGDIPELAALGFEPATITISTEEVAPEDNTISLEEHEEKVEAARKEATAEAVEQQEASLRVAMAGVDKGVLGENSLSTQLAAALTRKGVKDAVTFARNFVEKASGPFLADSLKEAALIRAEGPEYARGLSTTVERASYAVVESSVDADSAMSLLTSTAFSSGTPLSGGGTDKEEASVEPTTKKASKNSSLVGEETAGEEGNKFANVFSRM